MSAVLLNPSPEQLTEVNQGKRRPTKLHLAESEVPMIGLEHTDIIPVCQRDKWNPVPVRRAIFKLEFVSEICISVDDMLDNIKGLCPACKREKLDERYMYGIHEGIREGQAE